MRGLRTSTWASKLSQLWVLPLLLLAGFASSCALYTPTSNKTLVKECIIPPDQSGTISGKWPATPVPIALFQGHWDSSESADIVAAADTWNQFFTDSKTIKVLNYGDSADSPRTSSVANPTASGTLCASGLIQGDKFNGVGNVVIHKLSRWPTHYAQNAIALTSFCTLPASPYPRMYMAVMEVNYQKFFVQGAKLPDLQSIILHEFGHLMGLNHSCEAATKPGTPNCNDSGLNPDYVSASMFPVFSFDDAGAGQKKRDLGTNDQGRANCLY